MTTQTNEEAELSNLARKTGGGRRVKDLRAFFSAFREEELPQETFRQFFYGDEPQNTCQKEYQNAKGRF
ncbi:MAG: hypothetical protein HYZ83_05150 [Candidatus Omnitrophica bacterium]|nr:hypothetical protein [Candidatus Omnitrophota bacterium]